ncbi:plasmid mobilization relaxosome protein MobC (plasmid) [Lichenicola cladoniae]|uniref:Plasmid mobilization relaxosome protein MobC n=1 Tax=Lichenicola cladoniae TaxID=1484109 RepID=A0A6M8HZP5_9PROT|nr:plasmid mobilization relaxosome protein MobC [Lichenicola cladoniae]NPD70348.1 plasmid mobilization relaxosome protein MobC [Acetobacteraceae bacterium]QKE94003.1 plasmid mobilization relaxosome protein MobC [Lichenicola cladoniae]
MGGRNGQELLSVWVPGDLAARFKAWARGTEGGASAALRRLILQAVDGVEPSLPLGATARQIGVRLKDAERVALLRAAQARRTTPANWLRSLAIVHLGRRPQWNDPEAAELREIGMEVRRVGNNLNQLARAMNVAVLAGEYPPGQGDAAREGAELLRVELRRLMAIYTGNFDYWGLPDAQRPTAQPGMKARELARQNEAKEKQRLRPRRRPARFADDGPAADNG